jgi:hypothetical protein
MGLQTCGEKKSERSEEKKKILATKKANRPTVFESGRLDLQQGSR